MAFSRCHPTRGRREAVCAGLATMDASAKRSKLQVLSDMPFCRHVSSIGADLLIARGFRLFLRLDLPLADK